MPFSEMPCLALQKAMFRRPKGHVLHGYFYVVDYQKVMKYVGVSRFCTSNTHEEARFPGV